MNFEKNRERQESNPGPLGEKQECYALCYAAHLIYITKSFFEVQRATSFQQPVVNDRRRR